MPTLSRFGQTPMAYKLFLTDTFPSWLFPVKQGATSIWERWDGWTPEHGFQDPGMNSFAHYAFGSVGQWMFQTVAGIDTAEPGYQKIIDQARARRGPRLGQGELSFVTRKNRILLAKGRRKTEAGRDDSRQYDGRYFTAL